MSTEEPKDTRSNMLAGLQSFNKERLKKTTTRIRTRDGILLEQESGRYVATHPREQTCKRFCCCFMFKRGKETLVGRYGRDSTAGMCAI